MKIQTKRLQLVPCNQQILETILRGDSAIREELGFLVPNYWTEFGQPAFQFALKRVIEKPIVYLWWLYLPILKNGNILLGSCGYKGEPKDEMVEIGYEVAAEYRNQGFATEIAQALVNHAFAQTNVTKIQAHTLAEANYSTKVLLKIGFTKVDEIYDAEDGWIWKWEKSC
jgi:RimJ/RimL family protein N-acetyltransferase